MSQDQTVEQQSQNVTLQPFSGRVLTGICFETGYSIWLYDFNSTPTDFDSYRELWVVEPDDSRILYYDTEGANAEIARYHDWDRAVRADMEWKWTDAHIDIHVEGSDVSTVVLTGEVGESVMSRLLSLAQRYLPGPAHERMFMARTETEALGHLKTRKVAVVTEATANFDGSSLGSVSPPDRPITFGEVRAQRQPLIYVGDLLLEYPVE